MTNAIISHFTLHLSPNLTYAQLKKPKNHHLVDDV